MIESEAERRWNGDSQAFDGIKLEYTALSAHFNSIVVARFTYLGAYLTAAGLYLATSPGFGSSIAALLITIVVWSLELRNRVLIRAVTGRLVKIEVLVFGYRDGFWAVNHPGQVPQALFTLSTTSDLGVPVYLPWPARPEIRRSFEGQAWHLRPPNAFLSFLKIPSFVSYSTTMDFLFWCMTVISIVNLLVRSFKA